MRADDVLLHLRDAAATVSELLDRGVDIVSIHIGPTRHPPTVRVAPGDFTASLPNAQRNPYSGELYVSRAGVEIAWVDRGEHCRAALIAHAVERLDRELERSL